MVDIENKKNFLDSLKINIKALDKTNKAIQSYKNDSFNTVYEDIGMPIDNISILINILEATTVLVKKYKGGYRV